MLRRAKRYAIAQVEHIGLNGKPLCRAHVADNATGTGAAFIADVARRFNRYAISDVEHEVGSLTDKTATGSLTNDAKGGKINFAFNGYGRAVAADADEAAGACANLGRLDGRDSAVGVRKRQLLNGKRCSICKGICEQANIVGFGFDVDGRSCVAFRRAARIEHKCTRDRTQKR